MRAARMEFTKEGHAIVAAIHTSTTCTKIRAEVSWVKRRPKTIVDRVIEGSIQFATLCRHQHAPEPDVHWLTNLELPDDIEHAHTGITSKCICSRRTRSLP
jgi:hypothetical protein